VSNIKRISTLDSLRGIAAIGVAFFWHYQHYNPQNGYPFSRIGYWFYTYGWNLVDLFFVLSGFVFSYVYGAKIVERKISFKEYGILRFSRLYPIHFVTLLLVASVQFFRNQLGLKYFVYGVNDIFHFILNLFFVQSGWLQQVYSFNGPSWSVSVEIFAYIVFFGTLYFLKENVSKNLAFSSYIVLGLLIIKFHLAMPVINSDISRVLMGFFIGCLLYNINEFINSYLKKYINLISNIVAPFLIVISVYLAHSILSNYWTLIYTFSIYPLIILIALNSRFLNILLSFRPLTYLGEISYSIYLLHFPVQLLIVTINELFYLNINFSSPLFFLANIFLTLTISAISYEFFEKTMSKRIRNKWVKSYK
jgi:peptidoglycan/LPS O-acetylase OafA/YrhL